MKPASVAFVLAFALAACPGGCLSSGSGNPTADARCASPLTVRYLAQNADRWRAARADAAAWLTALTVDPITLRQQGRKGKKHFVEALDAAVWLVKTAAPEERERTLTHARTLTAVTTTDAYHDMLTVDDTTFKQDATSYLRALVLMEQLGLETARYREEIVRIKPRLDAHMKKRGVHQRLVFSWYYEHLGFAEPFPLASAAARGVIAARLPINAFTARKAYDLTHEVFAPYRYGATLDVDPFSADDKLYLRAVLPALVARQIVAQDPDLVAELVSCLRFLRFTDLPAYRDGLAFLLLSQRSDGSWRRGSDRLASGPLAPVTHALHPTVVALGALSVAFHPAWNNAPGAWCPPEGGATTPADAPTDPVPHDAGDTALDEEDEGSDEIGADERDG